MFLSVDPSSVTPLFEQLVAGIREQVIDGSLTQGERLPAARDLADSLDVNVAHRAARLPGAARQGFLDLRRGRGAVVASRARDYAQLGRDIDRVVAEAKKLDLAPSALTALIRKAFE